MPHDRLEKLLAAQVEDLDRAGPLKGRETVIVGVVPPQGGKGPRYLLQGQGERPFLRMNANAYLGLSFHEAVMAAEEAAVRRYGTGPGAVRFISGTWEPHVALETRLAAFHGREAAMIFSSAYATILGVLTPLITKETAVISDELNHNCIINAIRMAQPAEKHVYRHLDMEELAQSLKAASRACRRAIVVTDGIFSMRGDHAPLERVMELAREEHTDCPPVDVLVATLGKAFGVNGGYVTAGRAVIDYLRETSPCYIYSNPITPGEAAAAETALDIVDSPEGRALLDHLRAMALRFDAGLNALGFETIPGEHPVVPLMVRDTDRTSALVTHLRNHGILATGLNYPVVPRGDEEIRFQISADHTEADVDEALEALRAFPG